MNKDESFMREALRLAEKGAGLTSPNPLVGAVVVKNGNIVGKGFHRKAGLEHAEILALRQAKDRAKGANLYVNLEPCNHFGKTPPCTDALITSGIKKVFVGMRDPNPVNDSKGLYRLRRNGIAVKEGILKKEAEDLNRPFTKFVTEDIPYVTVKLAQSLDGKIATRSGDSKWISGSDSLRFVHQLRRRVDAVLVGIGTVLKDNPLLTSRFPSMSKIQPKRVVIDGRLRIPLKSRLFQNPHTVIIATTKRAPKKKVEYLRRRGTDIIISRDNDGSLDLKYLLRQLAKRNIVHLLIEGGGKTVAGFLEAGLIDEMLFFVSPKIIGGRDAVTSVEGRGVNLVKEAVTLGDIRLRRFGNDILIQGRPPVCSQA